MNKELLQKRLAELAERAYEKQIYTFTDFLSMDEISAFHSMKRQLSFVPYRLFGGMEGCERQVLCFGSAELCGYEAEMPIRCLKAAPINPKFAEKLSHRDFLGALIGLGIDRSALGDIILKDNTAYFFCLENMAEYLTEHFSQVRRTNISCETADRVPADALPALREITVQVSSERMDAIIAHVWHLSRGASAELFSKERVYINSALCLSSSHKPSPGDIISLRGTGRFVYGGVVGTSKKGKLNVNISLYE